MYDVPIDDSYDVVVMGGGPGGSATSALVAEAGYRVLLVEREAVPRFHVGESLMLESFMIPRGISLTKWSQLWPKQ